mmetsp:Transcript_652/g.1693  ORF Transcript_652/g.1693 Transcript_652/m.1693 type:complete len:410 (-) Transcript_652:137-1366(-)
MPSCLTLTGLPVLVLAVLVGYMAGTSPVGIRPPHIPNGSPLGEVPPWPIFNIAVRLNDLLRSAAEATTLPKIRALDLATARFQSQVTHILTKNDVFDAVHEAPLTCAEVAAKLELHEPFLCRLMEAGTTLGLLSKTQDKFGTTAVSALFVRDVEGSLKSFVEMINNKWQHPAWDAIGTGKALRTGESGFDSAYGESFWDYLTKNPEDEAMFNGAMTSFTAAAAASILSSYQFPTNGTICDVGGSEGGTLKLLLDHYPNASGIVFDRPTVIPEATAFLSEAGLSDRAQFLGGDFFSPGLPSELGSCDVFLLKLILHDWDDSSSITILKNIKAVAKAGARLAVVEHVLGVSGSSMERAKALMDINMMASCQGGSKERGVPEFEALFAAAGISAPVKLVMMRDIMSVVEVAL